MDAQQYRRKEDGDTKLLILLNERVENMQKILHKVEENQTANPCKTHDLRLKYMERIMWIVTSAVIMLTLKELFLG